MTKPWVQLFCYPWICLLLFPPVEVSADMVYVWNDDANGSLVGFDTNGFSFVFSTSTSLNGWNGPTGLALDNVGNIYAGCPGQSEVFRFTPNGTLSQVSYPDDSVSGLAFDLQGRLFATVPNYVAITGTAYSSGLGYYYGVLQQYTTSNLGYPVCLAFDSATNIYVSNAGINSIEKFARDFTDLGTVASGTNSPTGINVPWGIAFDQSGSLFVANSGNSKIIKIQTNGVRSIVATSVAGLNAPHGLAFDSSGNLYVANYGDGNVLKLSTNGVWSVFASGLSGPTSIAIFPGLKVWSAMPLTLKIPTLAFNGALQLDFISSAGLNFSVLSKTDLTQNWTTTNSVTEISPGDYQFVDPQTTNYPHRFYRIRSP